MSILNQYSYIFITAGVLLGGLIILRFLRLRWRIVIPALLLAAAALGVGYLVLRPGASDVDDAQAAVAIITNGSPTLLEFYSNYCAGCLTARPLVDALVATVNARFAERFNVLRIDIHTDSGRALRDRYGFSFTPEFVLFDRGGEEVWRAHVPPSFDQINTVMLPETITRNSTSVNHGFAIHGHHGREKSRPYGLPWRCRDGILAVRARIVIH